MNIINIEQIYKTFGDKIIFDGISLGVQEGDKIGIVGINGTGKSTLLKIIAGREEPDQGSLIYKKDLTISYLPQDPLFPEDKDILTYVIEGKKNRDYSTESEGKKILNQLGIYDYASHMTNLSGGQRKRIALARALIEKSDVFILDEPTNHLDSDMVTWLENYLAKYKGTIIMVSHDRYFLDQVSNRIVELSYGSLYSYDANYSGFLQLKADREEREIATSRKRKSILRMELEWAKRGCKARSTKQKARLQRLENLKADLQVTSSAAVEMDSVGVRMGKKTIILQHVSKSFCEKKLIDDFSYIFLKNQTVGIIGPNGCGKSTLLKMIAGFLQPDEGTIEVGETIKIGYFAQEEPDMNTDRRVIHYIRDIAEYVTTKDGQVSASQMLERFLFDPSMQSTPVSKLSGGEKRRLYLLSVLMAGSNVLLMDEPTNSLDIPTLTILEDYLSSFAGIVIVISHDRYFLDNTADRIFAFEEDGKLKQYEGGYTDYMEAREEREKKKADIAKKEEKKKDWKKNSPKKLKFTYMEQKEFESIEEDIAQLEEKVETLTEEMQKNTSDYVALSKLTDERNEVQKKLDDKMERWIYLNDLAEKIEAQGK